MKVHLQIICNSDCSLYYFMPDKVDLYHAFIITRYRVVLMTFSYQEKSIISQTVLKDFKGPEDFTLGNFLL